MGIPRLAATVILMRAPFEVYLTRRSSGSAFAADAFVFPGGTVEPQDGDAAAHARIHGRIDSDAVSRTLLVAATRELFEEAGVLLACTQTGEPLGAGRVNAEAIARERAGVRNGALRFADFLASHDWYADARALAPFSHWITPSSEPRRYDTHFFLAVAPADQTVSADSVETHDGRWISPDEALARHRAQRLHLVYPTIKHLERLATFGELESLRNFARSKPIYTIEPATTVEGDFSIPVELEDAW
jgi:8-oxo-dGTP pyrophosphatase MutT (NUDIX family)